jgi:tetratricopeptide (TPR) repeat protein
VEILTYLINAGGEIAGALVGTKKVKLIRLAERLHNQGLVYTYKRQNLLAYTAHPFLREYFRDLLGVPPKKIHEVVRIKLAIRLHSRPDTKPRKPEMLDRYETLIEHSILAGRVREAYDLFDNAMGGGPGSWHLYHILGGYGRIIRILSLFSPDGDPKHLAPQLPISDRAYLINAWGLAAQALGDLSTARRCFDAASELYRKDKNWWYLSYTLTNSARAAMFRGDFPSAQKLLKESLEHAPDDAEYVKRYGHGYLADTCFSLGQIPQAKENFAKATEILGRPLYSLDGIYEAEHLFALGNKTKAYEHTVENLTQSERYESLRDIALCFTLLGLLSLPGSISEARSHLKKVREWTDQSGHMEVILRAHILAAEIAYCSGDWAGALAEVATGLNQAEGCGYGKFAIELLLQLAKIHLAIPEPQAALRKARNALDRSQHPDCRYAWGEANALHLCGICHKELGEPELARKRFKASLKVRKRIQHPGTAETEKILNGKPGTVRVNV